MKTAIYNDDNLTLEDINENKTNNPRNKYFTREINEIIKELEEVK